MPKKYYVVWKGEKTGVFTDWNTVKGYTQGRNDSQFMGFDSEEAAQDAFKLNYTQALINRSKTISNINKPANNATNKTLTSNKQALTLSSNDGFHIYSDGACSPNPGASGTGMAVYNNGNLISLWYGLHQPNGTNNTAELNGLLTALRYAKHILAQSKPIEIFSDSKYSIDCITKWAKGWKSKGWKRGKNEEIKNLEIIKSCYNLYMELHSYIKISHVKGHADIEGNELADRMAVLARMNKELAFKEYDKPLNIKYILTMPSG